jgi:hypothetical protein
MLSFLSSLRERVAVHTYIRRVTCAGRKCTAAPAMLVAALVLLTAISSKDAQAFGGHGGGVSGRGTARAGTRPHAFHNPRAAINRKAQRLPNTRSVMKHVGLDHRRIGWSQGHWRHERRRGLLGWWWDVGSQAYFYPEPTVGPPPYVSETEIPIEVEPPRPTFRFLQQERQGAIYYAPGDNIGVKYSNGTECAEAQRRSGEVGVCLLK